MRYSVYAVLGVCCTRCMLYLVYAVLGVCCTQCMLYSVYAILSVYSWLWHGEIERDNSNMCSAMMVELWTRKRDGGWRWEQFGGYEWIWEIKGTTWLIAFRRPRIDVITDWIRTRTCYIRNGKLTRIRNSLKSQCLMMISHLLSSLSVSSSTLLSPQNMKLSHPSPSRHAMIISEHWVQHTPSTANTEYCKHRVLKAPSTATSKNRLSTAPSRSGISHLLADLVVLNSLHSHNYELTIE